MSGKTWPSTHLRASPRRRSPHPFPTAGYPPPARSGFLSVVFPSVIRLYYRTQRPCCWVTPPKKMTFKIIRLFLVLLAMSWFGSAAFAQTLVSAGRPVTASTFTGIQYPSLVTDGLYGQDQHWSAGAYAPQWITVDLEQIFPIASITVIGPLTANFQGYTVAFDLKGSTDNSNWDLLGSAVLTDGTDMGLRSEDFSIGGDYYRYIRLDYYKPAASEHHSSAAEILIYAVPEPATTALVCGGVVFAVLLARRRLRMF